MPYVGKLTLATNEGDTSKMLDYLKVTWYGWMIAGFCVGVYLHCNLIRHWLHLLAIGILRSLIWIFKKTDLYYKEPNQEFSEPVKMRGRDGIPVAKDDLTKWLRKNPDLSVSER